MALMLRVRGPGGIVRIEISGSACVEELMTVVSKKLHIADEFKLEHDGRSILRSGRSATLASLGLKQGDMLQLVHRSEQRGQQAVSTEPGLDEVDKILLKQDGRIPRSRDALYCKHGSEGRCIHCTPLEPYDNEVLNAADPPIKFLSFQSYLRKLNSGADHGRLSKLEELDCKIKPCNGHLPWPRGICTRCQPSAVTLQRQSYRHVDYVQFENPEMLNDFITAWRLTGHQRVGYLYGRYEVYDQVPLGVKAVVAAIYEPPQHGSDDGLELLDDIQAPVVESVAAGLGLRQVGWVFTDLEPEDLSAGTVKYKRYVSYDEDDDTTVFTAAELLTAATLQNQHPNPVGTHYADSGFHGSKFVSVVVSGAEDNSIVPNAYQASTHAMALTQDDILRPSDSDKLMAVKPSSDDEYVPDIFFVEKDKYGNQIKQSAKPTFPTEYLMVDMPAGASVTNADPTFARLGGEAFPIENREALGQTQSLSDIAKRLDTGSFLQAMSDFHLQIFMATHDVVAMLQPALSSLWDAIRTKNADNANVWRQNDQWATVELLARESVGQAQVTSFGGASGGSGGATWACPQCTLVNKGSETRCAVCQAPRP